MKIYRRYHNLRLLNCSLGKFCWTHLFFVTCFLSTYCFQGNDAVPLDIGSPASFECHAIFDETFQRHKQLGCSCKCWIWCNNKQKCLNWSFSSNFSQLLLNLSDDSLLYNSLITTYSSCCSSPSNQASIYKNTNPKYNFICNRTRNGLQSSLCDISWGNEACCVIMSANNTDCSYFILHPFSSVNEVNTNPFTKHLKDNTNSEETTSTKSDFLPGIEVSENEGAVLEPFQTLARVVDKKIEPSTNVENPKTFDVSEEKKRNSRHILEVADSTNAINGELFTDDTFQQVENSYHLSSSGTSGVRTKTFEKIEATERPLSLRPSGRTTPISPRENDTLSPAAGVIIYDVLEDKPASREYLSQYTWDASIALLYNDIYPGEVLGTTFQIVTDGSNEILFNDIILSNWGYSYIFEIKLRARETDYWNLTCLIGPFDVDMLDTHELPLIDSEEFRALRLVFDGDYQRIARDKRKFEIFFLNRFGRAYPKVRWKNVSLSEGSVIVDAVITGLTEDLDKTSGRLAEDIGSGKANIQYESDRIWKASRISVPSRKLLEETSDSQTAEEGGGGLSVAWIVAIAINVILIVIFILTIIYCWFRRKKKAQTQSSGSAVRLFDGHPDDTMYANKAAINNKSMEQKAALIDPGHRGVFTIEDETRKQMEHHNHGPDERCTCYSPTCYCSTGDKRQEDIRMAEENEDDPQGYPTPSPPPAFPTPVPSPEPEEYWRPDSFQPEEEEEDEDMFLPGTVSEPEPEKPREDRFYVYHADLDGSRELFGQVYLPVDSFLSEVRKAIEKDRELSEAIRKSEYRFVDENLEEIMTYQESSLDLERVFPSQEINIQFLQKKKEKKEPKVAKMPKIPAYVGPLGICSASDCTRAAKIKCLDCRNTAYCSKRCMSDDIKEHRRACYKPAWRL
ncbi:hypothetical protein JTE90_020701 [Oedothorax gibbosus]|uniref:MYND-type domain-containing protein n=1 Tax=Oedothorax gibbosus TaxID=931172 RepID=A0AAV6V4K1_9ARAC|nr:hypothetical protein JTE90_020701 [Oedothorax gibbosus]